MRFQKSQVCLPANSIQSLNPSMFADSLDAFPHLPVSLSGSAPLSRPPSLPSFRPHSPWITADRRHEGTIFCNETFLTNLVRNKFRISVNIFFQIFSWHNIVLSLRANQIPIFRWCVPVTNSSFLTESTRHGSPRATQRTSTEAFPSFTTSQPMSPTAWASDSAALMIRLVLGKRNAKIRICQISIVYPSKSTNTIFSYHGYGLAIRKKYSCQIDQTISAHRDQFLASLQRKGRLQRRVWWEFLPLWVKYFIIHQEYWRIGILPSISRD